MNRQAFVNKLKLLMPGVSDKDIVEQLGCINFDGRIARVTDGRIFIRATLDEDTGMKISVPAKLLYAILNSIKSETVELSDKTGVLQIKAEKVKGKLTTPQIEGVPVVETIVKEPPDDAWNPIPDWLINRLKLCKFSCSKDQTLGALTGVRIEKGTIMSCDRFRMSRSCMPEPILLDTPINLSVPLIQELEKHSDGVTDYWVEGGLILFRLYGGSVVLGGSLIEGPFPFETLNSFFDFDRSCPEAEFPVEVISALSRQEIIQQDVNDIDKETIVSFEQGGIVLSSKSSTGSVEERVDFSVPETMVGKSFPINPIFFSDILKLSRKMLYSKESGALVFEDTNITHMVKVRIK